MRLGQSKVHLIETLRRCDVNHVPHYTLEGFIEMYRNFETSDRLWGLRTIAKMGGGLFIHGEPAWKILSVVSALPEEKRGLVLICESMLHHDREHLVCNGEVLVRKGVYGVYEYNGWINRLKGISGRAASRASGITEITTRHQIPERLFNLIWSKGLIDFVVEFSIYDVPVGIKQDNLLIWEIRKY